MSENGSHKVRVAIIGVGNCASSLIQGVEFYKDASEHDSVPGLMHVRLGGYHVRDIEFTAAFDISDSKVGRDLSDAIFAAPNNTIKFADVPRLGAKVDRGMTHDGLGKYLTRVIRKAPGPTVDIVNILKQTKTDVVVNYLPVGSEMATKWYVEQVLEAGCGFVNSIPVFIASQRYWQRRFEHRGLPVIGDDIKSQVGATITHRVLTNLFRERGVRLDRTYQLNFGGNTDFMNMLERERLESKKISKTQAVTSQLDIPLSGVAAGALRDVAPELPLVLGGISPIDSKFIQLLERNGLLEHLDAVAVHGFPLDWNHWQINDWPKKLAEIRAVTNLPLWVTEVGVSTFGADEIQVFGLQRTAELLLGGVDRVFWYSLLDLPPTWEATTRHKESEGSAYYRHFYMGLIRADGSPKPAINHFNPRLGICQWFHFQDHRLDAAVDWLRKLGVRKVRTGVSWADWHRPGALEWFDRQMGALDEFETTVTLCFTPPSRGREPKCTSPPIDSSEFAEFAALVAGRYVRPAAPRPLAAAC